MAPTNAAMTKTSVALIAAGTVGSVVGLIFVVVICFCCWRRRLDDSYDSADYYVSVPPEDGQPPRSDVKQLRKHSWRERADARGKSPLLTRKTIKFERPADRKFVAEQVQPDSYSQSTLNKQLGVGRDNHGQTSESPPPGTSASASDGAIANPADPSLMIPDEPPPLLDDSDYNNEKLGKIQFSLKYDFQEMTLTLKVMRAIELPAKDFSGTSDPYVKIMLLPDKKHKLQTNIKRRNLNPRWNEVFAFEGFPFSKLQNRTLYMQVLDYDRFSRDDPIGEIAMALGDIDLATGVTMWRSLQPCKGHTGKLGELLVSMCYQPTVGRITLVIMKGRGLKSKDINGLSDPYVKIWMCHDGKKVEKKKTTVKERDLNPVFNESFIFDVPYEKIRTTSLVVSVMDYDRMGRNELIGQVVLGSKSGPMEVRHWNEMFSKSRQPVAQWHILKDFG